MTEPMVTIEKISKIIDHPDPKTHSLEIATIQGWQCVVKKGEYSAGERVIYFQVDSILPQEVESRIFGENAKVKLSKSRVKTIKLRGAVSKGFICPFKLFDDYSFTKNVGDDITKVFGVTKFEPKLGNNKLLNIKESKTVDHENPYFMKVRKPTRIEKVPNALTENDQIVITEKIHGTSSKSGWIKRRNKTIREKIISWLLGDYQFCYRSMNQQLQKKDTVFGSIMIKIGISKPSLNKNLYSKIVKQYDLISILPEGFEIAYEIYGDGVQKNYNYGCKQNEHRMVVYGVLREGKQLTPFMAMDFCKEHNIPFVPVLYKGHYKEGIIEQHTSGKSVLDKKTQVREGCVIEKRSGEMFWSGSSILKSISPAYEMKDQTEFH